MVKHARNANNAADPIDSKIARAKHAAPKADLGKTQVIELAEPDDSMPDVADIETASIENTEDEVAENQPSVARSTALMSVATLGSRVTGLVRTWAMAFALGNTLITSAYQVANTLPNAIYDLVAGGLLGAAFIPVYLLQKEERKQEGASSFASTVLNLTIIVLGILAILCTVFAPAVIASQTFTVSDTAEVTQYAVTFFQIFAVQVVFYGIGGVITGILNAHRVYFLPSLAPALNNVVVIASFFAYIPLDQTNHELAILVLAVGTTLGVVVQFVIQIPALAKCGFKYSFKINLRDPALIEALKIAVPTCIYIVGTLVAFTFRNAFSVQASEQGPATLAYAWMWFQLPYGVVAVSLSRALFTEMSEDVAKGNIRALREHVHSGLSNTLTLIIPLTGLMFVLSVNIMQLFQAGAFNSSDVEYVASILRYWVISLPVYSIVMYLYNTFASMRKFGRFTAVCTIGVAGQVALYAVLTSIPSISLAGVPIADLAYYSLMCVILLIVLWKMIGSFKIGKMIWSAVRVLAATVIGCFAVWYLQTLIVFPDPGMLSGFLTICICGIIGLVLIFALSALLQVPFAKQVIKSAVKLLKRK